MKYRCVECGHGIKSLFVQYSLGNIRLMKCDNCKAVADEYIECEFMITLIDLVLHKPKAYRHLLFNVLDHQSANFQSLLWKLTFTFLLLDAYRDHLFNKHEQKGGSSANVASFTFGCWKMLMDVSLGNFMLICIFIFGTKIFLNKTVAISRCMDLLLAILVSSYFKVFLIAMMVWEFPSSVIVIIIDLYVLSSNAVALSVVTESTMNRCIGVCFCAHAAKFLATQLPNLLNKSSDISDIFLT